MSKKGKKTKNMGIEGKRRNIAEKNGTKIKIQMKERGKIKMKQKKGKEKEK